MSAIAKSRIDPELKRQAEAVLEEIGLKPRAALELFYKHLITRQFEDTPYEVTLPRVPWLREQRYLNVQSIQPVKFTEFVSRAPEQFDARVINEVNAALKRWLRLEAPAR